MQRKSEFYILIYHFYWSWCEVYSLWIQILCATCRDFPSASWRVYSTDKMDNSISLLLGLPIELRYLVYKIIFRSITIRCGGHGIRPHNKTAIFRTYNGYTRAAPLLVPNALINFNFFSDHKWNDEEFCLLMTDSFNLFFGCMSAIYHHDYHSPRALSYLIQLTLCLMSCRAAYNLMILSLRIPTFLIDGNGVQRVVRFEPYCKQMAEKNSVILRATQLSLLWWGLKFANSSFAQERQGSTLFCFSSAWFLAVNSPEAWQASYVQEGQVPEHTKALFPGTAGHSRVKNWPKFPLAIHSQKRGNIQ